MTAIASANEECAAIMGKIIRITTSAVKTAPAVSERGWNSDRKPSLFVVSVMSAASAERLDKPGDSILESFPASQFQSLRSLMAD
jgi:hypothetical protein